MTHSASTKAIHIPKKKKIALVCSGGAVKAAAFHLGVALALREKGFKFYGGHLRESSPPPPKPMDISTYVGSSAGSIIATLLSSGYTLENIINSFQGKVSDHPIDQFPKPLQKITYQRLFRMRPGLAVEQLKHFTLFRKVLNSVMQGDWESLVMLKWLKLTGLFSTEGLEEYLREEVLPSNKFQDFAAELFIVATQLNHSRKVVFGKYSYQPPPHDVTCQYDNHSSISDACAASTALPLIYAPHTIFDRDGKPQQYIDGEIRDTLSTHVAVDAGADLVIASYTHQPYHLSESVGPLTEMGLPAILIQTAYLVIEQKINNHIHNKQIQRNAIDSVSKFLKRENVSDDLRKKVCDLLERELHHRLDVDMIYIHPKPDDHALFFGEHFTLNRRKTSDYVKSGFRSAHEILRRYHFEDLDTTPEVQVAKEVG